MPVIRTRATTAAGAAVITAAALFLGACGSSGSTTNPPGPTDVQPSMSMPTTTAATGGANAPSTAGTINITNYLYEVPVSATPGETITVHNNDNVEHSVTADDGSFTVDVPANGSATLTAPAKTGSFAFHCTYHPQMHGTLVVS